MDLLRSADAMYRLQHLHDDGTWAAMAEVPGEPPHGPADHDPERRWMRGRIFKCTKCAESVTVVGGSEGGVPDLP